MPAWLYTSGPYGLWVFLLVTVVLGGLTAFVTGKSIAETWRPLWQVPAYAVVLAATVRFLHYALYGEVFISLQNFVVDYVVMLACGLVGYRLARARQMANQYFAISH